MSNPADARRRWFGLFFLFMAIGMLIWGQTILKPHLESIGYVLYWLGCFAFTLLALVIALVDFWIVRQRTRKAQHELVRHTVGNLDLETKRPEPTDEGASGTK